MLTKEIKEKYLNYLTEYLNDFDVTNIDGFIDDEELSDENIDELLDLSIKVVIVDEEYQKKN